MKVKINFLPEFEGRILDGQKTATTRSKIMGYPNDWFEAFGRTFIIMSVWRVSLGDVANEYYKQEGFETPNQFKEIWERIHPRMGYKPERKVYLHLFKNQHDVAIPHLHFGWPCETCGFYVRDDESYII